MLAVWLSSLLGALACSLHALGGTSGMASTRKTRACSRHDNPPHRAGHVEDVVVDSSTRGTGLGKMMVGQLTDMALAAGCYKILLNCVAARKDVASPRSAGLGPRRAARGCTALGPPPVCRGAAPPATRPPSSDCTLAAGAEKNIGFYEKCGYVVKEVSMAKYLDH